MTMVNLWQRASIAFVVAGFVHAGICSRSVAGPTATAPSSPRVIRPLAQNGWRLIRVFGKAPADDIPIFDGLQICPPKDVAAINEPQFFQRYTVTARTPIGDWFPVNARLYKPMVLFHSTNCAMLS